MMYVYECHECSGKGVVGGYNRDNEPEVYTCEACGGTGGYEEDEDEDWNEMYRAP